MIGLVLTSLYTSSRKPTLNMNSGSFSLTAGSFALVGNLLFAILLAVELNDNKLKRKIVASGRVSVLASCLR